jgi:hypothetical protein
MVDTNSHDSFITGAGALQDNASEIAIDAGKKEVSDLAMEGGLSLHKPISGNRRNWTLPSIEYENFAQMERRMFYEFAHGKRAAIRPAVLAACTDV